MRLFIFDDRVEIHAPGNPPNTVDEAAMRVGVHVPRNPIIYKRLADLGLVTRVGSGIPRMIELVKEATGRDLRIEVRDFEVSLVIAAKKLTLPEGARSEARVGLWRRERNAADVDASRGMRHRIYAMGYFD